MTDTDHVRHMEEASVAGESPDRSKQRESSAEPTSGSASPVPEARSSAPDPRLAVARESVSLGGVDTATRIFSVRDLPKTPEKPEKPEESPTEPEPAPTATEPTDGSPEATERPSEAAEATDTADTTVESDTATDSDEGSGDAEEGSGESEDAGDEAAADSDEGPEDSEEEPGDADAEGDEAAAEGDARLRDAVAAWVSKADGGTPDAEAKGDSPEEQDPDTEKPDSPGARGTARQAPTDGRPDDDDRTPDAEAKGDAPEAAAETAVADDEHDSDTEKPDSPGARGTARQAPTDGRPDDDDRTPDAEAKGDAPEAAAETAVADDEPVVDQPTAVFKAPRPPVDQPTTMLKLGKAAPEAKPEPKPEPKPEAEAERTSRFVALKPLDEPRTPTPRPKADETAAVPQVGPERTTQQPLPPKPPLDLLAELTNTPPPPPSPLRTVARRVKIWTPLVLLLIVVFAIAQSVRPLPDPTLKLTAEETYTFDGGKTDIPWPAAGQAALDVQGVGTFGSTGGQKPQPIASVAKVMTAYIILRDHPLKSGADGPKIKIDQAAQDQVTAKDESTVPVTAGDSITQREALTDILIASANNVARLLARWDSGSEKAFVSKMNATAKDLGMTNTTYTDPSGLNNTTVSTAVDQVKLARKAMELPAFREVAAVMSYFDYKGNKHNNYNRLVGYNNVVGIKTGTTTSALGNLVFAAKKEVNGETYRIIGAVVRQPAGGEDNTILAGALAAGKQLILAAQDALKSATILKKGDVVGYVDDGLGGHTPVVLTKDVTAVGWSGLKVELSFTADDVPHTAKAGTKVGTLTVGDGDGGAVTVPVTLQKDLTEPGFADKLTRVS
ncbi:D-alanyl-D-alanine carboxypeptidase [Streptomyces griseorubiginosus]|uniref:D-alanyl-D-alanine carboxypeptidase n=1 Tax=Streptomyces griseorubiginosus TaxID=67304 RepID=UPI002E802E1F|nr:D-alanyl-D-alanine carboxypeptidase [Streptomyces griseorubiginosus]WUB46322.1 D-alanyl-D-alanine carboxypeptidase [Streptomyces griseorubiginosus]WUB54843.1 D-alanyl-D-alanine carboxypeptidase [Streptomyces griseorubiginosus]